MIEEEEVDILIISCTYPDYSVLTTSLSQNNQSTPCRQLVNNIKITA